MGNMFVHGLSVNDVTGYKATQEVISLHDSSREMNEHTREKFGKMGT